MGRADRITVDAARLDPRAPSALKRVVEGNDQRSCRHKGRNQQPEETARHFAAAPAVPVEHAMVVRIAPVTSTSTWRKVGPVKQDRNGSNQVDINSDQGWTGMA
jgi:hypothetical protein